MKLVLLLLSLVLSLVRADIYVQNPRGGNDRLNETGDRNNANRLFDSENNARGGYCWGPSMSFVSGSILNIEWTAQHSCGTDKATCNEVIQYMCSNTQTDDPSTLMRDGHTTNTIPADPNQINTPATDGTPLYGMNEPLPFYQACAARERNQGLFVADQTPQGRATATRQNPNANRYGLECAEERDYYPYWHPSPWKDIAVLVGNLSVCGFYQNNSQNVLPKFYCANATTTNNQAVPNNERACVTADGKWVSAPAYGIPPPDCLLASFSRDNHLGNGPDGTTANYTWILPSPQVEPCITTSSCNCVLRVRYNISTVESGGLYGNYLDSRNNTAALSPITNDPTVLVEGTEMTLAINTQEFGRTFQDRSYIFHILPRPAGVDANAKIYNLNVRGKRGNIVQVFPATEYDFTPNNLTVQQGDYIHFQWTGCDTNPQGNQGEGTVSTDRSNIVQIASLNDNIPAANQSALIAPLFESQGMRSSFTSLGQTNCLSVSALYKKNNNNQNNVEQDPQNCAKLNAASPYFDGGLVRMNTTGTYNYMSTRNNNFSNRSQKGTITVTPGNPSSPEPVAVAGIVVGVGAAVCFIGLVGLFFYGKKHPTTSVGHIVHKLPFMKSSSPSYFSPARAEPLLSTPSE